MYTNDLVEKFELKCRTHTTINAPESNGNVELIFPLRSLPEWSLGGKCHELMLRLPHSSHYAIEKVEIVPAAQLIRRFHLRMMAIWAVKDLCTYLKANRVRSSTTMQVVSPVLTE